MRCVASWSGGKDCCFACHEAIRQGHQVSHLVNFISEEHRRVRFHGTEARLIELQSQSAGIPLVQRTTAPDDYEPAFKAAVRDLVREGAEGAESIEGMVFGDLYVDEHREWVERVCREVGVEAIEPLWGRDPERHLLDFIDAGFEAVVVSANAGLIDREWIGRKVDRAFLEHLKAREIDPCGEAGEYHTLVTGGPLFAGRIAITRGEVVRKNGYWFLDTVEYELRDGPRGSGDGVGRPEGRHDA